MTLRYDISSARFEELPHNAISSSVASPDERDLRNAQNSIRLLRERAAKGELPMFCQKSPYDCLEQVLELTDHLRDRFSKFLAVGMGGATLNPQSVAAGSAPPCTHEVIFLDHVDCDEVENTLADIDPEECCFIVVSKSGATLETMAQFCFLWTYLYEHGITQLSERFVFITEPGDNPLREAARSLKALTLDHPRDVGGRFAAFTPVGLLPGALAGADVEAFVQGGMSALSIGLFGDKSPALDSALLFARMTRSGVTAHVVMSYLQKAMPLMRWYCQIWSESLGKNGFPIIPVAAQGTQDQHSQLQLFLGGKNDKFFTMFNASGTGTRRKLATPPAIAKAAPWLSGKNLFDVNNASFRATCETLRRHGRPFRTALVDKANASSYGEFMMYSMLEVVIFAGMHGVNPFDQPHVEEGKRLTRRALARLSTSHHPRSQTRTRPEPSSV